MNIRPPDVRPSWDDNNVIVQAELIAYNQIRGYEEQEERNTLYKMLGAKIL
jgi:hypothetical protein